MQRDDTRSGGSRAHQIRAAALQIARGNAVPVRGTNLVGAPLPDHGIPIKFEGSGASWDRPYRGATYTLRSKDVWRMSDEERALAAIYVLVPGDGAPFAADSEGRPYLAVTREQATRAAHLFRNPHEFAAVFTSYVAETERGSYRPRAKRRIRRRFAHSSDESRPAQTQDAQKSEAPEDLGLRQRRYVMNGETDAVRVLAQRFIQDGVTMYVTALPAGVINRLSLVDTWKPHLDDTHPDQGYQRAVVTAHAKRIAKYLLDEEEERLMPTAVLLSSRKPLQFEPLNIDSQEARGPELGYVELEFPLFKVDGQHRTEGFAIAAEADPRLNDFPLPAVIMESPGKLEEIKQFFTINTTAKRVRTDLADRLLRAMGEFDVVSTSGWRKKALEIVDYLVKEPGGPWQGLIKLPNALTGVVSQRTWTESLKPVLDGVLGDQPAETIAKALSNYWKALKKLMPDAFEDPREYVIQRSTGVFALNEVAAHVFKTAYHEGGDFSVDHLKEILERAEDSGKLDSQFWASTRNGGEAPQYAGRGGMAALAREIIDAMPEAQVRIQL